MIDNLTTIQVDGRWYLCELHEVEKRVELWRALSFDGETTRAIRDWILRENLGELAVVRVSKGSGYVEEPLTAKERRTLQRSWADMEEVKRTALPRLENSYFLGKDE